MKNKLKKMLVGTLFTIGLLGATIYSASPAEATKCGTDDPYPTHCRP